MAFGPDRGVAPTPLGDDEFRGDWREEAGGDGLQQ